MKRTKNKKARFLYEEALEYQGLRRVRDLKVKARRIERRTRSRSFLED